MTVLPTDRTYSVGETLLSIRELNVWRGEGRGRCHVLRDVTVEVKNVIRPGMQQGQVIGLLGPSGVGKSTLFGAIAGTIEADSGTILLGADQKPARPGDVGVVTQDYIVFPHMTVMENLVFAGQQGGLSKAEAKEKAEVYLQKFDLYSRRNNWPVGQLSGGQRQRVAILQQVMVGHRFICMDEPFSGLDVNQVRNVAELICTITSLDELLTIIVVTHDIGAAIEVSDTLWLMGKDRDPGTKEQIEGAYVVRVYDLIGMGLAWDRNIRHSEVFAKVESDVIEQFRLLA
jgi:ABC-type nitrate/sulfonate/bicarbonate transport system ATPase subunit